MCDAGVALYAISYDDPAALADFASAHGIEYPLLADPESEVIRAFGILNTLIPEEQAEFHGIPFPGAYVTDGAGIVTSKFFENNQIFRPGPEQLLRAALGDRFDPGPPPEPVEDVRVRAYLDGPNLVPGLLRDLVVEFTVPEGQHLYGQPVPDGMVATSIEFDPDDELIVRESQSPDTSPHEIATGEVLHIYEGVVEIRTPITVVGGHGLAQDGEEAVLGIGDRLISGVAQFQTCDDDACGLPQTARFEVPVRVEPSIVGDFGAPALRNEPMHGGRHWHRLMSRYDRLQ